MEVHLWDATFVRAGFAAGPGAYLSRCLKGAKTRIPG